MAGESVCAPGFENGGNEIRGNQYRLWKRRECETFPLQQIVRLYETTQIQLKELPSLGGEAHIEKALRTIPGVEDVKVQVQQKRVPIEYENVDEQKLADAIRATGMGAELIPANAEVLTPLVPHMKSEGR
jgi:copper chaperone CopZ